MNQALIKRHLDALANRDGDLRRALKQLGYPRPRNRVAGFETFLSIIVGQQISTSAAAAILARVRELSPSMGAGEVLGLAGGALRSAGLSTRKVEYVQDLARAIVAGSFDIARLSDLDDEAVIEAITELRGFGRWSADIYLMFSLRRSDIFPAGDLALRVALQKLKRIDPVLSESEARELMQAWAPYRSAASLFLWHYYRGAPT